ncbi:MAG: hypothetical protein WDN27_03310 [Candidatus Saccharibacteria bacterium]
MHRTRCRARPAQPSLGLGSPDAYRAAFHRRKKPLTFALGVIVILAVSFGGGWLGASAHHDTVTNVTQQKVQLEGEAAVISNIAKNVGQSVVSVDVTTQAADSDSNSIDKLLRHR